MAALKCPICEINYLRSGDTICTICGGIKTQLGSEEEHAELCLECGEHPCLPGRDVCALCLKRRRSNRIATPEEEDELGMMPQEGRRVSPDGLLIDREDALEMDLAVEIPEDELMLINDALLEEDSDSFAQEDAEGP